MPFHLAQFNIARMLAPLGAERMRGAGDAATDLRPCGDVLINLSVWESLEALKAYTYCGAHLDYLRRRRKWFVPMKERFLVLWWISIGHLPTLQEGLERLEHLRRYGPIPFAFTINQVFSPERPGVEES